MLVLFIVVGMSIKSRSLEEVELNDEFIDDSEYKAKSKLPENFEMTAEFERAFNIMENTERNAYITGKAGTGKSTLLTYFREHTNKNIVILAPTGIAAINVEGSSIHSFFRFPPTLIEKKNITADPSRKELFENLDTIIIDEISMVRADLLDGIDQSLRLNRNSARPFGGVQMIFFGDVYQLPPVVPGRDLLDYFNESFGGIYFFNSRVFKELKLDYIELKNVFRQKDETFKSILNEIRENRISNNTLLKLNERFDPQHKYEKTDVSLTLTTTNKIVEEVNRERMNSVARKEYQFTSTVSGKFEANSYPTDSSLSLKKGAQIMMIKNDSQKRWVNGSLGIIKSLSAKSITIEIDGVKHKLEQATWEVIEYEYNKVTRKIESKVAGSFTQYPLKLAWAITIHKSQGQTFDKVVIDLGNGAFSHGQTYVALSRCRSLEGITLKRPIRPSDIIVDPKVVSFVRVSGR